MKDLLIREYNVSTEQAFVYNSWLHSYRSSRFAKSIDSKIYYTFHHMIIERILNRPTAKVLIATHKDTPDTILGYIALDAFKCPTIHFVYVKHPFRCLGIGRALLKAARGPKSEVSVSDLNYTHASESGTILLSKIPDIKAHYNPYLL